MDQLRLPLPHSSAPDYPFAVKIATGKVCAVTGGNWAEHLNQDPQDYVVLPDQPWIDGYCVEKGEIRQFIAMPLGEGYTVEEQITGAAEHGGIQIIAYPMKAERYEAILAEYRARYRGVLRSSSVFDADFAVPSPSGVYQSASMGLAPGGRMRQEIYDDPYGLDAWDQRHASRCFVTIANSGQWMAMTGEKPPTTPADGEAVRRAPGCRGSTTTTGTSTALAGAEKFADLSSVAEIGAKKGEMPLPENESPTETRVVRLAPARPAARPRARSELNGVSRKGGEDGSLTSLRIIVFRQKIRRLRAGLPYHHKQKQADRQRHRHLGLARHQRTQHSATRAQPDQPQERHLREIPPRGPFGLIHGPPARPATARYRPTTRPCR